MSKPSYYKRKKERARKPKKEARSIETTETYPIVSPSIRDMFTSRKTSGRGYRR